MDPVTLQLAKKYTDDTLEGTGAIKGEDGFSPTVAVIDIPGGHRVSITDAASTKTFDVMDGEDGTDGVSPTITVTEITGGHSVTITDANGTQTFDVLDGDGDSIVPTPTVIADAEQVLGVNKGSTTPQWLKYELDAGFGSPYVPMTFLPNGFPSKLRRTVLPPAFGAIGQYLRKEESGASWQYIPTVPSGGIVIWSGAAEAVPDGWALCNGENGTPELTVQGLSCLMKL